jgi:hypothetical protein
MSFEAVDDDAGNFGDVTFSVDSDNGDHIHFEMIKLNRKQSDLHVTSLIEEKKYSVSKIKFI